MQDQKYFGQDRSSLTGFAINPLNRLSERRHEQPFIDTLIAAPTTRTVIFSGETPVLRQNGNEYGAYFTFAEAHEIGSAGEVAFLGLDGEDALFATLIEEETPENSQARGDIARVDLRSIATQGLVSVPVIGALAQAKSLLYWHKRHRFCANCGTLTLVSSAGWKRDCPQCQAAHFPRTDPVVIMLVQQAEHCLLGRQPIFPAGLYSCLAGFLESGETIENAVRREVFEEAGLPIGKVEYFASQPWPFPASLMIGCMAEALDDRVTVDGLELEDARWFSREEVKQMLDKTHPLHFSAPPKLAIANLLISSWASNEWR
jgi:NAD+ diphosphatase